MRSLFTFDAPWRARFAIFFRRLAAAIALAAVSGAAAPAWSQCLTSTLVMPPAPYTNTKCITPPVNNNGITATGSNYTVQNSGAITFSGTAIVPVTTGIHATTSASSVGVNNSATLIGSGNVNGIFANDTHATTPTGAFTTSVTNSGQIFLTSPANTSQAAIGIGTFSQAFINIANSGTINVNGPVGVGISALVNSIIVPSPNPTGIVTITNTGNIVVTGGAAFAVQGQSSGSVSATTQITNSGSMSINSINPVLQSDLIDARAEITSFNATPSLPGIARIDNSGSMSAAAGNAILFPDSGPSFQAQITFNNTGVVDGQFYDVANANLLRSISPFYVEPLVNLTNAGLLTISYPGAGLPQVVTGNYVQTSTGILGLRINAAGQRDFLTAGAVSLAGTLLAINQPGDYGNVRFYPGVVQSVAPITTKFDSVVLANPSVFFVPVATYNTNTVDLTVARQSFGLLPGLTNNERAVGNAFETGLAAGAAQGAGARLYTALFGLQTLQQAAFAYDQLSGEIHADVQSVIMEDSRYAREILLARLRQFGFLGSVGPNASLAAGGPALAYADASPTFPIKGSPPGRRSEPDLTFWAQGLGAWGRIDSDGNAASIRRDLGGFFTGVDRGFGDWRAGLAAGYTSSMLSVAARASSATIDTGHIAAYAGTSYGALNLRMGADFAWSNVSTSRAIAFPGFSDSASARYGAGEAQIFGELGYTLMFGTLATEPFGGLAFVHLHTNSFAETGGIAALSGGSSKEDVGYSTLGARAATTYMLPSGMALTPRVSAAWQHAFGDVTPTTALAFQSIGSAFTVAGAPIAQDAALISAGVDLRMTPQAAFGVAYLGELASNARDHSVKGTFSWKF